MCLEKHQKWTLPSLLHNVMREERRYKYSTFQMRICSWGVKWLLKVTQLVSDTSTIHTCVCLTMKVEVVMHDEKLCKMSKVVKKNGVIFLQKIREKIFSEMLLLLNLFPNPEGRLLMYTCVLTSGTFIVFYSFVLFQGLWNIFTISVTYAFPSQKTDSIS